MTATSLLKVDGLSVRFPVGGGILGRTRMLRAVENVSFELASGETLGVVGESGCGKSTLARGVLGLQPVSSGAVYFAGRQVAGKGAEHQTRSDRLAFSRAAQIVFQDPLAALNPRMRIGDILAEPLVTHEPAMSAARRKTMVAEMLERVGLRPDMAARFPHEFSGGQAQRIGIARAVILGPKMLVCDEPVASLDVSIQAQIMNLLRDLQRDLGLAILFISHDLSVVRHIAHRVLVLYLGRVMECATSAELFTAPAHPYTRALISAVPRPDPAAERSRPRILLHDELPSPMDPPTGCVFRTRCPIAQRQCAEVEPVLAPPSGPAGASAAASERRAACHFTDAAQRQLLLD